MEGRVGSDARAGCGVMQGQNAELCEGRMGSYGKEGCGVMQGRVRSYARQDAELCKAGRGVMQGRMRNYARLNAELCKGTMRSYARAECGAMHGQDEELSRGGVCTDARRGT